MSKTNILSVEGKISGEVELPKVFNTPYRPDLIKRAVLAEQSKKRQPQGRSPKAGRQGAWTATRPGRGLSRIPRTHGQRTAHGNRATFINSTVGGKLAFPPKVDKKIIERINKKEHRLALWSAVSATADREIIVKRGHLLGEDNVYPIVVQDAILDIEKTSEVIEAIEKLGLGDDLQRASIKKVRAGKGKMRGRKYRRKTGPLLVVANDAQLLTSGRNIAGVTVLRVKDLSVEDLAPGTHPGRATIWSEGALKELEEWK